MSRPASPSRLGGATLLQNCHSPSFGQQPAPTFPVADPHDSVHEWTPFLAQVLLINFPSLGNNEAGEAIRFIFREAKIHDALLFFGKFIRLSW